MQEMGMCSAKMGLYFAKWIFFFQNNYDTFLALEIQCWLKQNNIQKAAVLLISGETKQSQKEVKASACYVWNTAMVRHCTCC